MKSLNEFRSVTKNIKPLDSSSGLEKIHLLNDMSFIDDLNILNPRGYALLIAALLRCKA